MKFIHKSNEKIKVHVSHIDDNLQIIIYFI